MRVYTILCAECAEKLGKIFQLHEDTEKVQRSARCNLCNRWAVISDYSYDTGTTRRARKK